MNINRSKHSEDNKTQITLNKTNANDDDEESSVESVYSVEDESEESVYVECEGEELDEDGDDDEQITLNNGLPIAPNQFNYGAEARKIIFDNEDITVQNALAINRKLQEYLKIVKCKLMELLDECKVKYEKNSQYIETVQLNKKKELCVSRKSGNSNFICGIPYFKTKSLHSPAPNAHYTYRRNVLKEFFPIDCVEHRSLWTVRDKLYLIQGVKQQIIEYLQRQSNDELRTINNETRQQQQQQTDQKKLKYNKKTQKIIDNQNKIILWKHLTLIELAKRIDRSTTFVIDWSKISQLNVDERHAPEQCEAMWNAYLQPNTNRKLWSAEEEDTLLNAVNKYNRQDWNAIAAELEARSSYQCFVHYQSSLSDRCTKKSTGKWTKDEDEMLIQYIEQYTVGDVIPWSKIAEAIPGRTKTQVYHRYSFTLKPGINRKKFTDNEDCILMAAMNQYDGEFSKFPPNLLPGRTMVQIRNRYNNVLRFANKRTIWTAEKDGKLLALIKQFGTSNWVKISAAIPGSTRFNCRSRYTTIQKYLETNPDIRLEDIPRHGKCKTTKNISEYALAEQMGNSNNNNNWIIQAIQNLKKPKEFVMKLNDKRKFFDMFKYAYKFNYFDMKTPDNVTECNLKALAEYFHCTCYDDADDVNFDLSQFKSFKNFTIDSKIISIPNDLDRKWKNSHPNHPDHQNEFIENLVLPPNWCTTVGLRAITIMSAIKTFHNQSKSKKNQNSNNPKRRKLNSSIQEASSTPPPSSSSTNTESPTNANDFKIADELFRKRFFNIFYTTALMGKYKEKLIEPSERGKEKIIEQSERAKEIIIEPIEPIEPSESVKEIFHYSIEFENGQYQILLKDENRILTEV